MYTILITDDSSSMRDLLRFMVNKVCREFKDLEFNILEADCGTRAREIMQETTPNLLLLDIIMPEGEEAGVDVLKDMIKLYPHLKIYMISNLSQESMIAKCKQLGAADFLVKPPNVQSLKHIVRESVERDTDAKIR